MLSIVLGYLKLFQSYSLIGIFVAIYFAVLIVYPWNFARGIFPLFPFLLLYFFFNLLDGQRGLFSYFKKKNLLENLQNEELELVNKIEDLEIKNSLLTNNLDLDYIETLIRQKFLFGKKEETLYIIKNNDN